MPAKYFICTRSRLDGSHTIHREGCPLLPEDGKRILLGTFKTVAGALGEAARHFRKPDNCPFCLKEHNEMKGKAFTLRLADPDLISSTRKIKTPWVNLMFCSLS
jgi:hypothetical protein